MSEKMPNPAELAKIQKENMSDEQIAMTKERIAQDQAFKIKERIDEGAKDGETKPEKWHWEYDEQIDDNEETKELKLLAKTEIIDSGIAERILKIVEWQHHNELEGVVDKINLADCEYRVRKEEDKNSFTIFFKTPNYPRIGSISEGFSVNDIYFRGDLKAESPLTGEQMEILKNLAEKQDTVIKAMREFKEK